MSSSISQVSTALVPYDPTLPHVALRTGKAKALEKTAPPKEGRVFVLLGTSSVGKSSVIHALKDVDSSWVEMGPDLAVFSHLADMIKETFPKEYEKMSQGLEHAEIAHAIVDVFYKAKEGRKSDLGFLHWKSGSYSKAEIVILIAELAKNPAFIPLDQSMYAKETADKINEKMITFICAQSRQGRSVFVDGLGPETIEPFLKQTHGYSVKIGLAYLPLHHLVDRVTKRNETAKSTGDDAEVRSYEQITRQFLEHFKHAEGGDSVIGYLSLEKTNLAFSKMKPNKEEEETLKSLKNKMIGEFGLVTGAKVPLASRFHFDVLVKTKQSPEISVGHVLRSYR
jgi:Chloramphenicol phosphotransferase-like protein